MCSHVEQWTSWFMLHCPSLLSCLNEYLAIDDGGHFYTSILHVLITAWLNSSQINLDYDQWNRSVKEGKCKVLN